MHSQNELTLAFIKGFKPHEIPSIRSWSAENLSLDTKETAKPGPYDPSITPYLDELYEVMHPDHRNQECSIMKGTQLAFSTLAKHCAAHRAVNDACSMLYVLPSLELAKKFSKQRITPLIENTKALRELINTTSRDTDNAWNYKAFPGGVLQIGGANSAASLSQIPVVFLTLDENDRFARNLPGEGDPSAIAISRLDGAGDIKKLLRISSPTEKNYSHIEDALLLSDWRKYFVPCPSCNFFHTLEWENFVIPRDDNNRYITEESFFNCPKCNREILENKHKTSMLKDGNWEPTKPENLSPIRRGYHMNSFYSPLGFYSWANFAKDFADATGPRGNTHKKRVFTNTKRAITFETKGDRVSAKAVHRQRILDWGDKLPQDACLLTAGVDVQDNRLELEVVAWNQYEDSYSIKYHVIPGSPELQSTWDKLDLILFHGLNKNRRTFEHSLSSKCALPILSTCIDMGGHATQQVLNYCASRTGLNVWAINGVGGQGKPVWPRKLSTGKYKIPFYSIGVDTAKETIYNRLKNETPNTGCCWFPPDREENYFKMLTSEEVTEKETKTGPPKRIWDLKAGYKRNEALDCRVYAYAALEALKLHGLVLAEATRAVIERAARG